MNREELIYKLKMDCNSLNCIAGVPTIFNSPFRDILLSIKNRIIQAIDILEGKTDENSNYNP